MRSISPFVQVPFASYATAPKTTASLVNLKKGSVKRKKTGTTLEPASVSKLALCFGGR